MTTMAMDLESVHEAEDAAIIAASRAAGAVKIAALAARRALEAALRAKGAAPWTRRCGLPGPADPAAFLKSFPITSSADCIDPILRALADTAEPAAAPAALPAAPPLPRVPAPRADAKRLFFAEIAAPPAGYAELTVAVQPNSPEREGAPERAADGVARALGEVLHVASASGSASGRFPTLAMYGVTADVVARVLSFEAAAKIPLSASRFASPQFAAHAVCPLIVDSLETSLAARAYGRPVPGRLLSAPAAHLPGGTAATNRSRVCRILAAAAESSLAFRTALLFQSPDWWADLAELAIRFAAAVGHRPDAGDAEESAEHVSSVVDVLTGTAEIAFAYDLAPPCDAAPPTPGERAAAVAASALAQGALPEGLALRSNPPGLPRRESDAAMLKRAAAETGSGAVPIGFLLATFGSRPTGAFDVSALLDAAIALVRSREPPCCSRGAVVPAPPRGLPTPRASRAAALTALADSLRHIPLVLEVFALLTPVSLSGCLVAAASLLSQTHRHTHYVSHPRVYANLVAAAVLVNAEVDPEALRVDSRFCARVDADAAAVFATTFRAETVGRIFTACDSIVRESDRVAAAVAVAPFDHVPGDSRDMLTRCALLAASEILLAAGAQPAAIVRGLAGIAATAEWAGDVAAPSAFAAACAKVREKEVAAAAGGRVKKISLNIQERRAVVALAARACSKD